MREHVAHALDRCARYSAAQTSHAAPGALRLNELTQPFGGETRGIEHEAAAIHHAYHARGVRHALASGHHVRERATYLAEAEQDDIGAPLPLATHEAAAADLAEPELGVDGALRAHGVGLANHDRDVVLSGSLRDRDDVDVVRRERGEEACGHAGRPRHPESHDGDRRRAFLRRDALDLAALHLARERFLEPRARRGRMLGGHAEAYGMFGRRLRDERRWNSTVGQRRESARGDVGGTGHPVPAHSHHRLSLHRR